MSVSPDTQNSSINVYHGPIASRPAATRARIVASAPGRTAR